MCRRDLISFSKIIGVCSAILGVFEIERRTKSKKAGQKMRKLGVNMRNVTEKPAKPDRKHVNVS